MLSSDSWTFSPVTNHTTRVETLGRRQSHLFSFFSGLGKEKGQLGSLRTTPTPINSIWEDCGVSLPSRT